VLPEAALEEEVEDVAEVAELVEEEDDDVELVEPAESPFAPHAASAAVAPRPPNSPSTRRRSKSVARSNSSPRSCRSSCGAPRWSLPWSSGVWCVLMAPKWSLSPSAAWGSGTNVGNFTYSYPIQTPPTLGGSLRFGLPRIPRLFGLSVVCGVMIALGVLGCLVGALFVAALVILSVPAMLLERIGVFAAIGRSFELVKGRYWQIVLMLLVIFVALLFISAFFGSIFGAVARAGGDASETANAFVSFIAGVGASAITTPIFAALLTVLYFDQRVRKEGFDLQLLADGIGERAPVTPQQPWQQPQPQQWPPPEPPAQQPWQQPSSDQSWQPPSPPGSDRT